MIKGDPDAAWHALRSLVSSAPLTPGLRPSTLRTMATTAAMAERAALDEAWLASLAPPRVSPRVFRAVGRLVPRRYFGLEYEHAGTMRAITRDHEPELSRFPELARVGLAMLARDRSPEERRQACVWLTLFPSEEMASALSRVLLDDTEPEELRNQAAWSLGFRQAQERHEGILWPATAVARANDALVAAWERGLGATLSQLAPACRHVDDPRLLAWVREHLDVAWPALEAFGDEALARALLERLPTTPDEHVHRAIRLAAHVLGAAAADALVDFAREAPYSSALESLYAAVGVGSTAALEALDARIAAMTFPAPSRLRREACLASPGVSLHVRALRIARTTATLDPATRRDACVTACADFARLAAADAIHESYLHAMWRHVAYGARHDGPSVLACVAHSPRALAELPALGEATVVSLSRAGRFDEAARVAAEQGLQGIASWEAARLGRPYTALRLAVAAPERTVWSTAGEALGAFLAGRIDLAQAALRAFDAGAQVRWEALDAPDPAVRAVLERDVMPLLMLCAPPPPDATPDAFDPACLDAVARHVRPPIEPPRHAPQAARAHASSRPRSCAARASRLDMEPALPRSVTRFSSRPERPTRRFH